MMGSITKLLGIVILSISLNAHAILFDVTYHNNDGSQWTGTVNSDTDTLTLASWVEGSGGYSWWTPTDPASLTFSAVDSSYAAYDVLDTWDGTIGSDWGFLSDLSKDQIVWNEGTFTGNTSRIGWGISENNIGTLDASRDETYFLYVPYNPVGNLWQIADQSSDFVSVTQGASVPAPAPLALLGIGILALGYLRKQNAVR